ncbi:MAG: AAA family ATPase [Methylomonas sp.]|nr:AAA family ATPase [Methylomonas sp.]
MNTFDQILPIVKDVLAKYRGDALEELGEILLNRDLNSRIRLIVSDGLRDNSAANETLQTIADDLLNSLGHRAYPINRAILFESDLNKAKEEAPSFPLEGFDRVFVVDRLTTEGNWASIKPESSGVPRIVFFSIKGGVGRSSALASVAWSLAQAGKRVLVFDLDLESPGLSSSLLPKNKQPAYGITDWLVEDLVDNGDAVLDSLFATSEFSHDGEIYVVPAHGVDPGEYVSKLGRVWMPKLGQDGLRESWSQRLQRLISALEQRIEPDVILIDSRAGIDEVASSCVTDLGASLVLLFAIDGTQTWSGYRILFDYWRRANVVPTIRERLQVVSALTPETEQIAYLERLRDSAYDLFLDMQYDEIPPGEVADRSWSFESSDFSAPHYPWPVKWHRSFSGLYSLHGRLAEIDIETVRALFGPLIDGIVQTIPLEKNNA